MLQQLEGRSCGWPAFSELLSSMAAQAPDFTGVSGRLLVQEIHPHLKKVRVGQGFFAAFAVSGQKTGQCFHIVYR